MNNEKFKPKIAWENYIDPFSDEDLDKLNYAEKPIQEEDEQIEALLNSGLLKDLEDVYEEPTMLRQPVRTVVTNMGAIPIYQHAIPSKVFKFYVGHANFNISEPIAKIIDLTPGVEGLDIFSRYRFRIAVGQVFHSKKVRKMIEDNVYTFLDLFNPEKAIRDAQEANGKN